MRVSEPSTGGAGVSSTFFRLRSSLLVDLSRRFAEAQLGGSGAAAATLS